MAEEEMNKAIERKNEIVDTVEKRKAEFEEASTEKREEILNEVEELTKEGEELDKNIADLEETRNTFKTQEERMSMTNTLSKVAIEERKDQISENVLDSKEYMQLYADYIRGKVDKREMRSFLEERAGTLGIMTGDYAGAGTFPVPTLLEGYVETAWEEYGKFSRLVSESFEPALLRIPVEVDSSNAEWHDEGSSAVAEEEITFGEVMLQPKMIKKWISLTDELMAMSADEFLRYVADELVYKIYLALDEAIINRNDNTGAGVIGITANAGGNMVETASATAIGFNTITNAIGDLVTFDNLTIAMNPATFFGAFMGLTDEVGHPIYQVMTDNEGKPAYYLNGYRVEFTQALPTFEDASDGDAVIVVGDFRRGYRLNLPQGRDVITLVDPYTLATADKVRMIGRLYAAGNVVRPRHFVVIQKATA